MKALTEKLELIQHEAGRLLFPLYFTGKLDEGENLSALLEMVEEAKALAEKESLPKESQVG